MECSSSNQRSGFPTEYTVDHLSLCGTLDLSTQTEYCAVLTYTTSKVGYESPCGLRGLNKVDDLICHIV